MEKKGKLELTWVGKYEEEKLEPRILIEDKSKSYGDPNTENMLIHGDNLLALKALENDYSGKIQCIYVDPPFNTGQAFDFYDDDLEHSIWLDLIYKRIKILYGLLKEDGLFWIHLDDVEVHYCKIMLDEIFNRSNFVSHITYERSAVAGLGQGGYLVNTTEHILLYKKSILPEKENDLVICMDEAHRYYAPASKKAINYLNPVLGLEYTATPKSTNKNIIYHYGLEDGAGKFLKIPVVMGRTNTAGYSDDDIEEMKLKDGIKLHERRKSIVYKYCIDNQLEQVKPIVLIACKDTTHARKIKEKIDSDAFFGGRYVGKVIEIDSSTSGAETEENIQKLLTIEKNTNPIEIVLHVYKLKEGWDVNNLFTIIPLNAAKSDILALQTIGRGLRLPFGEITGIEELDTLDIVAHDHYREIVDDIKNNPVFKKRNLDEEDIPNTKTVMVEPAVENQQISLFDEALCESKVKSYQDLNNENVVENLFAEYQKAFVKKVAPKKSESDSGQMSIFDYFANDDEKETNDGTASDHKMTQTGMGTDAVDTSFTVHQGDASLQIKFK